MVKQKGEDLMHQRRTGVFLHVVTEKNLMQCDCVIFVKKNYILDNLNVADALFKEVRRSEK